MIFHNATLVTFWERQPLIEGALLAIEGRTIVDFGRIGKLIDRYDDAETIDVSGSLVMPGLINCHHRLDRTLALQGSLTGTRWRGHGDLHDNVWRALEREMDEEDTYLGAVIGLMDAVSSGVTTVVDQHASTRVIGGSLDAIWQAFAEVGVRGALSFAVSDREGASLAEEGIAENQRFAQQSRAHRTDMLKGVYGIECSSSVGDGTLRRIVDMASESNAPLQINVAEDPADVDDARSRYQKTPVQRLFDAGALVKGSLAAHCVFLEEDDYRLLRESGASVAVCPRSNAMHRVGPAPLAQLRSHRVPLSMGTDGLGCSVIQEYQQAALADYPDTMEPAFQAAFPGSADVASGLFNVPVGRIKPGSRADLVVFDYDPPTPLLAGNVSDHLISGMACGKIKMVIINGRIVYKDGQFPGLDQARIRALAREASRALWEKI